MVTKTENSPLRAHRNAWEWTRFEGRGGRSSNAASAGAISARDKTTDENLLRTLDQDSLIALERITSAPEKPLDRDSLFVIKGITSEPEKSLDQDSVTTTDRITGEPEQHNDARTQFVRTLYLDEVFKRHTMCTTTVSPSSPQRSPQRAARRGKKQDSAPPTPVKETTPDGAASDQQIRKRRQVDSKKTATERLKVKSPRANENRVRKERNVKRTNELMTH